MEGFDLPPSSAPTELPPPTINETWQPIYATLILTILQACFFLTIYETSRRSTRVGNVYDRRRLLYPNRVPPPLPQKYVFQPNWNRNNHTTAWWINIWRCCCCRLLGRCGCLEWWRLDYMDPDYIQMAQTEYEEYRKPKEQQTLEKLVRKPENESKYLVQAEKECYIESPYYFPLEDDEDEYNKNNIEVDVEAQEEIKEDRDEVEGRKANKEEQKDEERALSLPLPPLSSTNDTDPSHTTATTTTSTTATSAYNPLVGPKGILRASSAPVTTTPAAAPTLSVPTINKPDPFTVTGDERKVSFHNLAIPELDNDDSKKNGNAVTSSTTSPSKRMLNFRQSLSKIRHRKPKHRGENNIADIVDNGDDPSIKPGTLRKYSDSHALPQNYYFSDQTQNISEGDSTTKASNQIDIISNALKEFVKDKVLFITKHDTPDYEESEAFSEQKKIDNDSDGLRNRTVQKGGTSSKSYVVDSSGNEKKDKREIKSDKRGQKKPTVVHSIQRRKLSKAQRRLLEMIGLDAFILLRLLVWGFDISFYPLLLACVMLIPLYKTGKGEQIGFWSITVLNLSNESLKLWLMVFYAYVQILYILRRLWVEWEYFLPLRYDFLENGDFIAQKYQNQYRMTCLVEYVPKTLRSDKALYEFFNGIFPGQIRRAEVLLNTEHLARLIHSRLEHIEGFEDAFAKKVHKRAKYLKEFEENWILRPRKPPEPKCIVKRKIEAPQLNNFFVGDRKYVVDAKTMFTLPYHHDEISQLNKSIDDEYLRLARAKRRDVPKRQETTLAKWLGLKYLYDGWDDGGIQSSTAFIEFLSLTSKMEAIQCNTTGMHATLTVQPVPEVRDIRWHNMHVSRKLIDRRKIYVNVLMLGLLIAWSVIVALIRSLDNISGTWFGGIDVVQTTFVSIFIDDYLPPLFIEGIVRGVPYLLQYISRWIRFKTASEVDLYVFRWYFAFRLLTFIFVIVGGSLVDAGEDFVEDPIGYIEQISSQIAAQTQFFITYVIVAGGMQIFFRLSQIQFVVLYWFVHRITTAEAVSTRRLERMRTSTRDIHTEEFLPVILFIFMVSLLYGCLAPISNLFVSAFFLVAYKVFKYMAMYIYGSSYEGGGVLFYFLTALVFYILYGMIAIFAGYISLHGNTFMAAVFAILFFVVAAVHRSVYKIFIAPSMTLSLAKARAFDNNSTSSLNRAVREYHVAKRRMEHLVDRHRKGINSSGTSQDEIGQQSDFGGYISNETSLRTLISGPKNTEGGDGSTIRDDDADDTTASDDHDYQFSIRAFINGSGSRPHNQDSTTQDSNTNTEDIQVALSEMEKKYCEDADTVSDLTGTTGDTDDRGCKCDFFIYRQPALNRSTWETHPRSYWETGEDHFEANLWTKHE